MLLPLLKGSDKFDNVKRLSSFAKDINKKRNNIVHCGEFCSKEDAIKIIKHCQKIVHDIVQIYDPSFTLNEIEGLNDD